MRKESPFVLSNSRLTKLVNAASGDPAILDLVRNYQNSLDHYREMCDMMALELEYFEV